MYCGLCGHQIIEGVRFCEHCGSPIGGTSARGEYRQSYRSDNRWVRPLYRLYPPGSFRPLYWGVIWTMIGVSVADVIGSVIMTLSDSNPMQALFVSLVYLLIFACIGIPGLIFWGILLYRSWTLIQDDSVAETTPGLAVGLNFIPIFSCYWAFVAQLGLAKGMNEYCRRRGISAPPVSEGFAVASSLMATIFTLSGIVSFTLETAQAPTEIKMFGVFITAILYAVNVLFDFFLYGQFADTAEAITQYKRDMQAQIP